MKCINNNFIFKISKIIISYIIPMKKWYLFFIVCLFVYKVMHEHFILCQLCRSEILYIIIIIIIYHIFVIDYRLGVEKRIKIS